MHYGRHLSGKQLQPGAAGPLKYSSQLSWAVTHRRRRLAEQSRAAPRRSAHACGEAADECE